MTAVPLTKTPAEEAYYTISNSVEVTGFLGQAIADNNTRIDGLMGLSQPLKNELKLIETLLLLHFKRN